MLMVHVSFRNKCFYKFHSGYVRFSDVFNYSLIDEIVLGYKVHSLICKLTWAHENGRWNNTDNSVKYCCSDALPFFILAILMIGCKVQYAVEVTLYNFDFCRSTLVNKAVVYAFFLFFVHK